VTAGAVVGALDIGGTHVTAGRVHLPSGMVEPGARVRSSLEQGASRSELLESILGAAKAVATPETERFGVAAPGPFDYAAGICLITHKLAGLYGVDLRLELAAALCIASDAVAFLNDTDAFLLGEWWAGAARGHTRVVGITLGTGLGSAFLDRGRLVHSGPGVPAGGDLYTLAFRGAPVEQAISRNGLLVRYGADPETTGPDVELVAARARSGERRARLAFEGLASDLADFLVPHLRSFAPTCLVVGGAIANAWDLLEPALRAGLVDCRLLVVARATTIDDAPLLGAAWHVSMSKVGGRRAPTG
jgi:predicted NBD/HSP70 family sugar kinase